MMMPTPSCPTPRAITGPRSPVVLVHGMRGCAEIWEPVARRLSARHEVLVVDLPGHGRAPREGLDGLTFDGIVDGLATTLRALFDDRTVHLVGHSLGGALALAFAARYPVASCTSVDEPLAVDGGTPAEIVAGLRSDAHDQVVDALMASEASSDLGEEGDVAMAAARALPRPERAATLGLLSAVLDEPLPSLVRRAETTVDGLSAPTLVLLGQCCPPAALARLEARPHIEIDHWPGAGHWLHLAEPQRFVQRLETFWASL